VQEREGFQGAGGLGEEEDSVHAAHCLSLGFLELWGKPSRRLLIDLRQALKTGQHSHGLF
jgi:hypothetical protein